MRTTIDRAGRVVVPKPLRDRLGLTAGTEVELEVHDGVLTLVPQGPRVVLAEDDGFAVLTTTEPVPPLRQDEVLRVLDESRTWPRT